MHVISNNRLYAFNKITQSVIVLMLTLFSLNAHSQGQDSTPAERDIMIISEMLPGNYRNANQAYFDVRLKNPEPQQHKSSYTTISRVNLSDFGDRVFWSESSESKAGSEPKYYLHSLEVDNDEAAVRMKNYSLSAAPGEKLKSKSATYLLGCDLLWRQEAGQFIAQSSSTICPTDKSFAVDVQLSEGALWMKSGSSPLAHFKLDRAREFSCYVDVPGVGGGVDIPYQRYQLDNMHDLGSEQWITIEDGTQIGIRLFRVLWEINNLDGIFTRPSLVVYAITKDEQGENKYLGYTFTESNAQRLGVNLISMLVNCYMISNEEVVPFFRFNEPKL
jgi:hypothetical protein